MSMRRILLPWTQQPQGALRIADEWQQYAPTFVATPGAGAVVGGPLSFVNDATVRADAFAFPGANGYIDFGSEARVNPNHTVLCVCRLDNPFASSYPIVASYKGVGLSTNFELFFSNQSGYKDLAFVLSGGWAKVCSLGSVGVTGVRHSTVVRYRYSGGLADIWVGGAAMPTTTSGGTESITGNNVLGQQSPSRLSYDFVGAIWLFALFDSLLPDQACARLSANPWQLFAPQEIWVPRSSGAPAYTHPTLSNARMIWTGPGAGKPAIDYTW